jgi:3-oxoacyl-[acyl-carrier-protein] synthase-1
MPAAFPITAYALCNALGTSKSEVLSALRRSEGGLRPCALPLPFDTFCGAMPDSLPGLPQSLVEFETRQARVLALLLRDIDVALLSAQRRWGSDRVGVVLGTSTAGLDETERAYATFRRSGHSPASYRFACQHLPDAMLKVVRSMAGIQGPGLVVSTACSSSAKVFGVARRWLKQGVCDAVLAGGVDTLCQLTLRGFDSLMLLSRRACRPFAADRDGLSLGEGGALLLVEREGEGPARLLGVGETSDAYHMTAPQPEGLGAIAAMQGALVDSGLGAEDVDHINAHGTATPLNDATEGTAIARLFGSRVPVLSTKGYTGHTLGAAGATEAAITVISMEHGFLPASLGSDPSDPSLPIQIVHQRVDHRCRVALSNSFAFGGSNACVAIGEPR